MAYLTAAQLKKLQVGMDFTKFSPEELNSIIESAVVVVENYCNRSFDAGTYTEKSTTVVDREGRIIVTVSNRPIATVTSLEFWLTGYGETRIGADMNYLDVFEKAGYMYYNTTHSPYTAAGAGYPSRVLSQTDQVHYEVVYTVTASVPADVQRAVGMIASNMLRSEFFLRKMNAPNLEAGIAGFTSDDYSVQFKSADSKYQGLLSQMVRDILDRYVHAGQNTFL